ncbi:multicopper oxidase [Achlya hypogyna]|uniref:Multicopper oxidase n=1 Tax=Achlya hypogyna TaxID=1202772 RepID=A0A0A7CN71_ACHHY|nr:secreted protein [Achlya hypogyna]OQR84621.1 multicopper oxidase [Achlya hypogyna]
MVASPVIGVVVLFGLLLTAFLASLSALLPDAHCGPPVNNQTVTYTMRIHRLDGAPDGVNRSMIGVNGGYGWDFVLRAREGQELIVHVINELDEPTTLHWHGIFQNRSNAFDGTSHVTQCPIPPRGNLTYTVKLEQSGTYWWHSHHGPQYIDGLRGPMIIDPIEPSTFAYDEDVIVQLSDWYHRQGNDIVHAINSPSLDINRPVDIIPDAAIVNGRGRFNCSFAPGKCTPEPPRATFHVRPGRVYRLRVINTAAFAGFNFSLDGHNLTVVSVDGIDVQPVTVTHLRINVAQRYDLLVTTPVEPPQSSYWLRATMNNVAPLFFLVPPRGQDIYGLGVWSYADNTADPATAVDPIVDLDDFALAPLQPSTPPAPDHEFTFTINIRKDELTNVTGPHVAINDGPAFPYRYTAKPTLFSIVDGDDLPVQIHPYVVNATSTVEITVVNNNQGEHPFHMHGHAFWVLAHGTGADRPSTQSLNAVENPLRRDTVAVTACDAVRGECIAPGWTVIRVLLNNPGAWLFHCHIEWDMATGMGMTLVVNPAEVQALGIPRSVRETCAGASWA